MSNKNGRQRIGLLASLAVLCFGMALWMSAALPSLAESPAAGYTLRFSLPAPGSPNFAPGIVRGQRAGEARLRGNDAQAAPARNPNQGFKLSVPPSGSVSAPTPEVVPAWTQSIADPRVFGGGRGAAKVGDRVAARSLEEFPGSSARA